MALQQVNVGTIPNDGTGDDPRTGISKVNSNFSDNTNAAAALVQTSILDNTVGRVLLSGAFGLGEDTAAPALPSNDADSVTSTGFYSVLGTDSNVESEAGILLHITRNSTTGGMRSAQLRINSAGILKYRINLNGVYGSWITTATV